jgi:hypothetical protein
VADFSGTIGAGQHMKRAFCLTFVLLAIGTTCAAQGPPKRIWGKWRIRREVPTSTISCWGEREVRAIIGTEIEYTAESFRWKNVITRHPSTEVANVSAEQFHAENSGQGVNSSQITLQQLGIKAAEATQITIKHPEANVTGATTEIPGDVVLLKDGNTIIFSVCNVYFEAERVIVPSRLKEHP